jgi:hypothetical protein
MLQTHLRSKSKQFLDLSKGGRVSHRLLFGFLSKRSEPISALALTRDPAASHSCSLLRAAAKSSESELAATRDRRRLR